MRLFLLILFVAGCAAAAPQPPASVPGPASCSGAFDSYHLAAISGSSELALYPELCDGGLYLIDRSTRRSLIRINPDWWHEDLISAEAQADGSLLIEANFITGIGPTGTVPFRVRYLVEQTDEGVWQATKLPRDTSQPEWLDDGLVEITSTAQLETLALTDGRAPIDLSVDFSTDRLLLKSIWLTSGSEKVTAIQIHRNNRAYFVTYNTKRPRIVTHDMKPVVIYLVLPIDHRYVSFEDPEYGSSRFRAQAGALDGASFKGMPHP